MRDIKVGDLVMVVRGNSCCGVSKSAGISYLVDSIYHRDGHQCIFCGGMTPSGTVASGDNHYFKTYKLKRIPPLSELESAERQEREPA